VRSVTSSPRSFAAGNAGTAALNPPQSSATPIIPWAPATWCHGAPTGAFWPANAVGLVLHPNYDITGPARRRLERTS
jgi:hypothetical protein